MRERQGGKSTRRFDNKRAGLSKAIIESARVRGLWSARQASRRDYGLCHSDPLNFGESSPATLFRELGQTATRKRDLSDDINSVVSQIEKEKH